MVRIVDNESSIQAGESTDLLPVLDLLCAPKKLDREKGEEQLKNYSLTESEVKYLSDWIMDKLDGFSNWEDVYGGLTASNIILQSVSYDVLQGLGLVKKLEDQVVECHDHIEFRVRIAAGQLMGSLCRHAGLSLFMRYLPFVTQGIVTNLERSVDNACTEAESSLRELDLAKERDVNYSRSSLSIFHDTAGWKNLETWMKCLQEIIDSLPACDFVKVDRAEILDLIFKAVGHVNRFVRETGYDVLSTVISHHGCYANPNSSVATNFVKIAQQLRVGLSDNWSQVRMAASRATRTFFEVQTPPGCSRDDVYPILLPPMCLSRYYVAEGVRIYSQDTWCRVTQGEGKKLLGTYLAPALDYYIEQSDADNHAVREAACASIAEIMTKLDPKLIEPLVGKILDALLVCFDDQSWPVRDEACVALGSLVSFFPSEVRAAGHETLLSDRFLRNLSDSIPSVRLGAAQSIAQILKSIDDAKLVQLYTDHIRTKLENVKKQPADSHGAESHRLSGKGPGVSHVIVHSGAQAHDSRHTDQVMYSCCSLAPKLVKGAKAGGCHDGLSQRPSEPWEEAEGAVRLIGQIGECVPKIFTDDMINQLLEATAHRHYTHYPYLLKAACDIIGQLAQHLPKPQFKRHLDDLLGVIAAAVESKVPLASTAASEALYTIGNRVGPNVLRGRIEGSTDPIVVRSLMELVPPAM